MDLYADLKPASSGGASDKVISSGCRRPACSSPHAWSSVHVHLSLSLSLSLSLPATDACSLCVAPVQQGDDASV